MKKRIIATLTLIALLFSCTVLCLPATASTQKPLWDGSEVEPTADSDGDGYIDITLPSHLAWVVANEGDNGGKYELLNDIWLNDLTVDTTNSTYTNNASGAPKRWYTRAVGAGKDSATFNGTIAGNGYTVHGLFYDDNVEEDELTSPGLIPFPKNATITDLRIDDSYIVRTIGSTVAAFCGRTHQITVTMQRCVVGSNVYIRSGKNDAAGFAGGGGSGSHVTLQDCVSFATIVSTDKSGGLAGDVWNSTGWKINNCYTTSFRAVGTDKVFSNSANNYSINGCSVSTALSTSAMTGANAKTNMAFDFDKVWMTTETYPLPRTFFNGKIDLSAFLSQEDIRVSVDFTVDSQNTVPDSYGIVIDGQNKQFTDSYTIDTAADTVYSVTPYVNYKNNTFYGDAQELCAAVLANIEYIEANSVKKAQLDELFEDSYIYKSRIWQTDGVITKQPTADSDIDGYIDIKEAAELAWVVANNGNNGGKYELLNDIVLNDISVDTAKGTYKSNTGLTPNPWYQRTESTFVGELKGNGHIVRGIFYDDNADWFNQEIRVAGGLIPYPKKAVINGVGVEDSYLKIFSDYSVGAIAGCVHGTSIKLTIDSCYAGDSVYVRAYTAPGGILGGGGTKTSGYVRINNCYSLAALGFGKDYIGGMIGNNWAPDNYSITNCYSIGPIAGNMNELSRYEEFKNNYSVGVDKRGGATPVTDSAIKGYDAQNTMSDLDFANVWITTDGYPTLKIFEPTLREAEIGITDVTLDTVDGIAFVLSLDGKKINDVSYGLKINGNDLPIDSPTDNYILKADADTVYTVQAYSEKGGNRIYDKEFTLCAAVSATEQYALANADQKAKYDSLFNGSQIYNSQKNDSITFSVIADFHYSSGSYINSVADLKSVFKRAHDNNASFLLSAGDFCNNYLASPEIFKAFLQNDYNMPAYNVYGNHDLQSSGNSMAVVTPRLTNDENVIWGTADGKIGDGSIGYYYFNNGGFRVVAIDTQYSFNQKTGQWEHNKTNSTSPNSENVLTEALGPVQLEWLEKVLLDAADKDIPCIVIGHDGISGLFATTSSDAVAVREIFAKANKHNPGTVLMCINGHMHTDHQGFYEGVFYLDMNSTRNCQWLSNGTKHYQQGQTFMYESYDDEGNLIEIVEKELTEATASERTWFAADPLSAIVTVHKNGVITINGVESEWLYGVVPTTSDIGIVPKVSSGTYFDCDANGHIYEANQKDADTHTLTCKNTLCGYTLIENHVGGTAGCGMQAECEKCAAAYGDVGTHSFTTKDSGQKAEDATCKQAQKNYVQCDNCNAVSDTVKVSVGDVYDHKYENYVSDNNATCCKDGTKTAKCIWCEAKDTVADKGTAKGHGDTTKTFKDVASGKWYVDAINYNYTHGFISGMSKTEFGVSTPVTRGMFITVLARIAGVDTSNNNVATRFSDVAKGKYYTSAIKWASENGIVNGMSATTFEPNSAIQRQQLCVMIVNFAKFMKIDLAKAEDEIAFTDSASIAKWAKDAVKTAQMADIVNGYANGNAYDFKPTNTATRAEAAQILYKFHKDFMAK